MAYEYPTPFGLVRLLKIGCRWAIAFKGRQVGQSPSSEAAAAAASGHETRLLDWDRARHEVPDDVLRWRPLGESL
jgi:hypothetical protein